MAGNPGATSESGGSCVSRLSVCISTISQTCRLNEIGQHHLRRCVVGIAVQLGSVCGDSALGLSQASDIIGYLRYLFVIFCSLHLPLNSAVGVEIGNCPACRCVIGLAARSSQCFLCPLPPSSHCVSLSGQSGLIALGRPQAVCYRSRETPPCWDLKAALISTTLPPRDVSAFHSAVRSRSCIHK